MKSSYILTHTDSAISSVSQVTGTGETTNSVSTGSISSTVTHTNSTLINICSHKNSRYTHTGGKHTHSPSQVTPSPLNPTTQAQVKLPSVLVQVAMASQLSTSAAHSSISIFKNFVEARVIYNANYLPIQTVPFPEYPGLQVQVKLP